MPHNTPLISTIVVALALAWLLGAIAHRLRVPPLVGYLLAGIAIGPFTPGFVADQGLANELSEIGVILLMFGVGLHFSLEDLLSVRAIAIPGAIVQIGFATLLGVGLAWLVGWGIGAGIVFGLALSVASTVVLLRAMQERRLIETERGRIAVGWLIVEDLAMVLALVLLPALAPILKGDAATSLMALAWPVGVTLAKVAAFVAVMLILGKRIIPWILHAMAHTGSRELFRLSVLVIALGCAYWSAALFGVSFALGAFFAGMILSESQLSQRAAQETLPLRDAFAVLFFAAVGMLFDPSIVLRAPLLLLATVFIIVIGKSLAAFLIVRAFRHPTSTALTISASLAQIGEFSFILASLGVSLALLPKTGSDLILAGAILSILINPLLFAALDRYLARPKPGAAPAAQAETPSREPIPVTALTGHVVLVGHGRVGGFVTPVIAGKVPLLVIEDSVDVTEKLKERGIEAIAGNAADPEVIAAANLAKARWLLVAVPDAFEGGQVVEQARKINPSLRILARAHSEEETAHLVRHGATQVIMGEHEIAKAMIADIETELSASAAPNAAPPATAPTGGATAEPPPPSGTDRNSPAP
jgi:monovalent cation:H+ antiporter-2, CPA2 family